MKELVTHFT